MFDLVSNLGVLINNVFFKDFSSIMIVRRHGRSKRNRLWQLGIFFLIYTCYTCFHALSATIENPLSSESVTRSDDESTNTETEFSSTIPDVTTESENVSLDLFLKSEIPINSCIKLMF